MTNDIKDKYELPKSAGEGVARSEDVFPERSGDMHIPDSNRFRDENGVDFLLASTGHKLFSNTPLLRGQLSNPDGFVFGPEEGKVFNLSNDLEEYNALLSQAGPSGDLMDGDPSIIILSNERTFYRGDFHAYVSFRKIWYKLPNKK